MKPLKTPLIDKLDLRKPVPNDYQVVWDWPTFPNKVAALLKPKRQ
jgi:hypothetical protein